MMSWPPRRAGGGSMLEVGEALGQDAPRTTVRWRDAGARMMVGIERGRVVLIEVFLLLLLLMLLRRRGRAAMWTRRMTCRRVRCAPTETKTQYGTDEVVGSQR